jgi:uncharacterized membrane protein YvbJ
MKKPWLFLLLICLLFSGCITAKANMQNGVAVFSEENMSKKEIIIWSSVSTVLIIGLGFIHFFNSRNML